MCRFFLSFIVFVFSFLYMFLSFLLFGVRVIFCLLAHFSIASMALAVFCTCDKWTDNSGMGKANDIDRHNDIIHIII